MKDGTVIVRHNHKQPPIEETSRFKKLLSGPE